MLSKTVSATSRSEASDDGDTSLDKSENRTRHSVAASAAETIEDDEESTLGSSRRHFSRGPSIFHVGPRLQGGTGGHIYNSKHLERPGIQSALAGALSVVSSCLNCRQSARAGPL